MFILPPAPSEGGGAKSGMYLFIFLLFALYFTKTQNQHYSGSSSLPFGESRSFGRGEDYFINPTPAVVLVVASIKMKAPFDLLSL